ncbi:MAG: hypothetical protein QF645_13460, partial [Planctomycetota bacterium]|nr:hypothetical protein [Planctomycetota bacterium]
PYQINYAADEILITGQTQFEPNSYIDQSLARFRLAFAYDFRLEESGFFTHFSVGGGLDVGFVTWDFESPTVEEDDTATGYGFGLGLLSTIYDNFENLKINFGIGFQSAIQFGFSIEPDLYPAFDMPQQFNAGVTFYLLKGTPLRLTFDFQYINWSESAEQPAFETDLPIFEDTLNLSVGAEYRIALSEDIYLYPRIGLRYLDAPWGDINDLPVTGRYRLVLDTNEERFKIFSFGTGISWTTEEGKIRTVDIAGDIGGDSFTAAVGYTHEF